MNRSDKNAPGKGDRFQKRGSFGKPGFRPAGAKRAPAKDKAPGRNKAPGKDNAPGRDKTPGTAGSARLTALKALYDVYYQGSYSNLSLDKQLKSARLSPEDRRLATNIFYQCVEHRMKTEFLLSPFIKQPPEQIVTCILHVAAAQILYLDRIPPFAAVNEAVNQARLYKREEAAGFVNVVLRNLIRARDAGTLNAIDKTAEPKKYLETEYSASPDTVEMLMDAYGFEEAEKLLAYRPEERYDTLRPNLLRSSDEQLERFLDENGYEWKSSPVPHAHLVRNAGALIDSEGYKQGLFSIQGQSAILAAMAVKPRRGMNVLDACAAPGGKAACLCELMEGSGRVYAWDLHEHRVELMKQNAKRLGLDNLRCAVRDACETKEDMICGMDAVLIDAPCSGLGVMADKPDIKYHLTHAKESEIVLTQQKLLNTCCEYVKRGGALVYSTCTVLPRENEEMIRRFLLEHAEFRPDEDVSWLPEKLRPLSKDGMLLLLGHRDGLEGFFIARLKRVL